VDYATKVVGYIRVSTVDQDENGSGLEAQCRAIEEACERQGWELVEIHADTASGKSTNGRPGLEAALGAVESGEAHSLVVAKLDRLSRSLLDFATLVERSRKQGWALVALDLGVDTSTPSGEMMANVLAVFAQFERRIIGQRTKDALAVKKAQGVRLGHPPQDVAPDLMARIRRERAAGRTLTAIADALNADGLLREGGTKWWPAQVGRVLTYDPPSWQAAHQPVPVAQHFPSCDRCSRRAVARFGDVRLCKLHHEQALRQEHSS
jgi:DNA invertase Pin-like site-specific DNA recombinase